MNKPHQVKTSHRTTLRHSTYLYLKHWETLETILTMESNYLLVKLALPMHPASSFPISVVLI